jgi:dolichol-phosphate mannosyltransferase
MNGELDNFEMKPSSSGTPNPLVSIVIPVFNEQQILPDLIQRLTPVLDQLEESYQFEVFFVDDGSTDRTYELLQSFSRHDERLKIITFSRNFGHQSAIVAGMDHSNGEAIITIDADLQDPPELIPRLVAEWDKGFKITVCVKNQSKESDTHVPPDM